MIRLCLLGVLGAVAVMAVVLAGCTRTPGNVGGELQPAGAELTTAARRVLEFYEARREADEPITPTFMERYCLASERLAEAEEAAARGDREAAARALAEHATRLEEFQSQLRGMRDGSTAIVDYFLARARFRLAQRRAAAA